MVLKEQPTIEYVEVGNFSEENWNEIVDRISILFNFSGKEKKKFRKGKMARLIGGLPFLADCEEPMRIALSHLATTILASHEAGKSVFLHNFSDNKDIMKRLERISHFNGGNQLIIDRGMNLLAIIMLADHLKDIEIDEKNGKYNPVGIGVWDVRKEINRLENEIIAVLCDDMDTIISINEAKAVWWEVP